MEQEPFIGIPEFARIFKLHPRTVWRMIHSGDIPAVKIGWQWRINPKTVKRMIDGHQRQGRGGKG